MLLARKGFAPVFVKHVTRTLGAPEAIAQEILLKAEETFVSPEETMASCVASSYRVLLAHNFDDALTLHALEEAMLSFARPLCAPAALLASSDSSGRVLATQLRVLGSMLPRGKFDASVTRADHEVTLRVRKCYFFEHLSSQGLGFLTRRTFCAADGILGKELLASGRYQYERPETMPLGCRTCVFKFRAAQKSDSSKNLSAFT